jgi:hypothetical protein
VSSDTTNYELDIARVPPKLPISPGKKPAFALGSLALVAGCAILFWFNPAQHNFFPFCMFHQLTGLSCPGCGGTRALHQLLHGHLMAALHLNALLVISLPLLGWYAVRNALAQRREPAISQPISTKWPWIFLALTVAFGVLRNLPAFAWLAPS